MKTWNFIVNDEVVDTVDQVQNKESFYWIVLDKVYSLTRYYSAPVAVCDLLGKEYSYV